MRRNLQRIPKMSIQCGRTKNIIVLIWKPSEERP